MSNETLEFSTQELQDKYLAAKKISEDHIKKMDAIGVDIRRAEVFLLKSGFGEFEKKYGYMVMRFDGKRLLCGTTPFIETKVKDRMEAHPLLGDFLESIAMFHVVLGDKK
jgi:hypothetical protein